MHEGAWAAALGVDGGQLGQLAVTGVDKAKQPFAYAAGLRGIYCWQMQNMEKLQPAQGELYKGLRRMERRELPIGGWAATRCRACAWAGLLRGLVAQ